ncbi:MAG: NAD(P)-dependent oxidoreductase [Solirubrobacterales bacterium]
MDSALITGAAGFIGSRLRQRLGDAGVEVRGLDFATDLKRGITAGDITEPGPWQASAEGSDVVIHAAAVVSNSASSEVYWRTHVLGTRHVLDAAVAAGAKRFVHISSVRAYGDTDFPDDVDETYPVRPDGNGYVDTKVAAEQVVLQAHAAGEIECTVLRPADVYGPGSRPWTVLPVEAIRSNRFVLPAMGRGIFSPLYVDNLLDAIELAADHPEAAGQVFNISDGRGVPCREFFGHYSRMLGKEPPRVLPTVAALGLVSVPQAAARIAGTDTESNRATMRYFARPATYSIEKARRVLGYEPKVGLDEGMRQTENWLRQHGLLR